MLTPGLTPRSRICLGWWCSQNTRALLILCRHHPSAPGGGTPGMPVPYSSFAAISQANNEDLPEKRLHDKNDCVELKASNRGASPALENDIFLYLALCVVLLG